MFKTKQKIIISWLFGPLIALCAASCENHNKLTSYFKPLKEINKSIKMSDMIYEVSFLFIIDSSGSMQKFKQSLSENIERFLTPIFNNYPNYTYNFAITTMIPAADLTLKKQALFFDENFTDECGVSHSFALQRPANIGFYLRHSSEDLSHISYEQLVCALSHNIRQADGGNGGAEFYFQSLSYIIETADSEFKENFFGAGKMLVLFFLSDAHTDTYFERSQKEMSEDIAEAIAANQLKALRLAMKGSLNIRSYAVAPDNRQGDDCGDNSGGRRQYPIHLYDFITKTKGLRFSICEDYWGHRLSNVFDNLNSAFIPEVLYFDDIPKLDTIEVILNGKKVPKNSQTGWFFNPQDLSVNFGPDFNLISYIKNETDSLSNNQIAIRYMPLNTELLRKKGD